MDEYMTKQVWVLDFTGIYSNTENLEQLCQENTGAERSCEVSVKYLDLRDIQGTNCYCDEAAKEEIRNRIQNIGCEDIRLLDSGNYHYMSRLLAEKVKQPFQMLVLDNHTDMQPPAFGGLLSCGGWVLTALQELPFLSFVIFYGQPFDDLGRMLEDLPADLKGKVAALPGPSADGIMDHLQEGLPLYISIDKDILSRMDVYTNWNQGETRLAYLEILLQKILVKCREKEISIVGIDIAGEPDHTADEKEILKSWKVNRELIRLFTE